MLIFYLLDTIEENVTTAADNVEEGNVQLQQAEKYQVSALTGLSVCACGGTADLC